MHYYCAKDARCGVIRWNKQLTVLEFIIGIRLLLGLLAIVLIKLLRDGSGDDGDGDGEGEGEASPWSGHYHHHYLVWVVKESGDGLLSPSPSLLHATKALR